MAEVLVTTQTIPIMNLHPADAYHGHSSSQSHNSSRNSQAPRTYGSHNVSVPYRGPVAPYAFQSTPNLRPDARQNSAPTAQRQSAVSGIVANNRQSYAPSSSASTASSNSASNASSNNTGHYKLAKDDALQTAKAGARPESTFLTSSSTPDLSLISFNDTSKPSPNRYRGTPKRVDSSGSVGGGQQASGSQRWSQQWPTPQAAHQTLNTVFKGPVGHTRTESADDIIVGKQPGLGRYRRRSVGALDPTTTIPAQPAPVHLASAPAPTWSQVAARGHGSSVIPSVPANASRPIAHHRNDSAGSQSSAGSGTPRRPVTVSFRPSSHILVTVGHFSS
jgi:hypothetical protein